MLSDYPAGQVPAAVQSLLQQKAAKADREEKMELAVADVLNNRLTPAEAFKEYGADPKMVRKHIAQIDAQHEAVTKPEVPPAYEAEIVTLCHEELNKTGSLSRFDIRKKIKV